MVNAAADLAQFVQRRELMAYEQRLARMAYAYGVDLRRATWLDQSTLGDPLMRGVDRRWNETVAELASDTLQPANTPTPPAILDEIARIMRLLRAPLPAIRLLRTDTTPQAWPIASPLGTTHGGAHWLILDLARLRGLPETEQTFLLASALGNLQCDHGPIVTAHLMAHRRGRGLGLIRALLRPWSKVSVFSADRAALLALGELEPTIEALKAHADPGVAWMPRRPEAAQRLAALGDFDKSRVMTRLRLLYDDRRQWTIAPPAAKPGHAQAAADPPETSDPDESSASAETDERETPKQGTRSQAVPAPEESPNEGSPTMEDETVFETVRAAWSLARCDERLTRRLGLL